MYGWESEKRRSQNTAAMSLHTPEVLDQHAPRWCA